MPIPYGIDSMVKPLRHVMVQPPMMAFGEAFDNPDHGFLHTVDLDVARKEHALFCEIVEGLGATVHLLEGDSPSPDIVYTYDASLVANDGAILLRSGKPNRRGEETAHDHWYRVADIPIVGRIDAPGTVDGGDVFWLREDIVCVGRSLRTNQAGIDQLAAMLPAVHVFDVPVHRGSAHCLHTLSSISMVTDELAIVETPLLASGLYSLLRELGITLIDVPESEVANLAGNVLAVLPGVVVAVDGNPITRRALEAEGVEVHTFSGHEIAINGSGGPTCLTRPVLRA